MRVRITEHTTTEEFMCVIEDVDGDESWDWFGNIEEFKHHNPYIEIVEEVWS